MKYKIADYDGFMRNVFGADCFVTNFSEIITEGVELEKIGEDYYIMDEDGNKVDYTTFFTEEEMIYLEPA